MLDAMMLTPVLFGMQPRCKSLRNIVGGHQFLAIWNRLSPLIPWHSLDGIVVLTKLPQVWTDWHALLYRHRGNCSCRWKHMGDTYPA